MKALILGFIVGMIGSVTAADKVYKCEFEKGDIKTLTLNLSTSEVVNATYFGGINVDFEGYDIEARLFANDTVGLVTFKNDFDAAEYQLVLTKVPYINSTKYYNAVLTTTVTSS
jgi:hypothetical protein